MRTPPELYELLSRSRRAHSLYGLAGMPGMLSACTDLTPPLLREESDALLEWMECSAGPRDVIMSSVIQHHWFAISQAGRAARMATWKRVRGGRASHAFVGDAEVPLCGIVPVRTDGTPSRWHGEATRGSRRSRHGDCVRAARDGGHLP